MCQDTLAVRDRQLQTAQLQAAARPSDLKSEAKVRGCCIDALWSNQKPFGSVLRRLPALRCGLRFTYSSFSSTSTLSYHKKPSLALFSWVYCLACFAASLVPFLAGLCPLTATSITRTGCSASSTASERSYSRARPGLFRFALLSPLLTVCQF
jgi:hypothetical protein